ncbi:MAG TPA: exodeoxyribonuclease VII large subunit [Nitrospiria bacterium]
MLPSTREEIHTVSGLTRLIKTGLEERFGRVWVEGEISNLKAPSSGHLYLSLKDESTQIRCVLFRFSARGVRFKPQDGQKVLCRGRLTVYEPRGDYQLILEYMEPRGVGALQLAFEQLKERLSKEGLFDPSRKKELPMLPRRIAVVTSPSGAAIQDILKVLRRRFANLHVLIAPVPGQGEGAAERIAAALDELNGIDGIEVIILARGGGSLEDLWAFNEEAVARAIARSGIPVVSAVGHEVDFTIADFVADLRAPTPSAAAEMVVASKKEFLDHIQNGLIRLERAFRHQAAFLRERLESHRRVIRDPRRLIEGFLVRLDELEARMTKGARNVFGLRLERYRRLNQGLRHQNPIEKLAGYALRAGSLRKGLNDRMGFELARRRARLEGLITALDSLSPLAILGRGYSLARKIPEMILLKDAGMIRSGEQVHVQLSKGALICRVEETRE